MPIESSIALGVKPVQLESPINMMSNVYALQNAQQSNQLNQMKMEEYKRGLAEEDQFKNALLSAKDDAGIKNAFYSLGQKGVKAYNDYQKSNVEVKNLGLAGKETESKLLKSALEQSQAALVNVRTPEQYLAWHEANHTHPIIGPYLSSMGVTKDSARGNIETAMNTPGGFQELLQKSAVGLAKFTELNKPNIQTQNLNDKSVVSAYPGLGGAPTILSSTPMGISPAEKQRLANENKRLANEQNPNVVAHQQVSEDGTVTNFNKFGQVIGTVKGAGKPSAQFIKTKAAKQQLSQDLDLAINELENATKKGGLIETATGSGLGALRDMGAGFIGKTTAGAEALGALQPIYDKVLKMVPRFEGPQSDKDTASYSRAAGDLGNAAVPTDKKLAAAKTILRLMKDRKAQFLTRDMAEGGTPSSDGVDSTNPLLKQ